MQDGISELGFSMRIDSQSELGMYISMNVNSESSDFMNTLSESESNFVIKAEKIERATRKFIFYVKGASHEK